VAYSVVSKSFNLLLKQEKERKAIRKRERAAIERAAATPETSAGEPAVEAKSEESVVGTKEEEPVAAPKVEDPLSAEKQEPTEARIDGPVPEAKVEDAVTEVAPPAEPQLEEVANADKGSEPSATEPVKPNCVEGLTIQTAPALNDLKANDAEETDSPVVGPDSKARRKARKKAKRLAEEKAAAAQETTAEGAKPSEEPTAEATPNADFSATPSSTVWPPKNNVPSTPTTLGGRIPLNERLSKPTPSAWPPTPYPPFYE
jgi:hypothetical protein